MQREGPWRPKSFEDALGWRQETPLLEQASLIGDLAAAADILSAATKPF